MYFIKKERYIIMKKLLSALIAVCLLVCACPAVLAAEPCSVVSLSELSADKLELTAEEAHEITFSVNAMTVGQGTADIFVRDEEGNTIVKLRDDGKGGDLVCGDGTYSAKAFLEKAEPQLAKYTAVSGSLKTEPLEISFYHLATAPEIIMHERLWSDVDSYEKELEESGLSDREILDKMYEFISESSAVDKTSVVFEDENSFNFTFKSGIRGFYARFDETEEQSKSVCFDLKDLEAVKAKAASWENPNVLVFRPYRNTASQGSFTNEFYSGIAKNISDITGGNYTDCIEAQAYPGNLKNIDNYGFFLIDSHGLLSGGKSYMIMRKGDTSQYDYADDISAGHIITSGSDIAVTGSFFTKYIKNEGKQMPGTLVYLTVCHGMQTDALYAPMISSGAQLVAGYDESVSFKYDFELSEVVWKYMCKINPDCPERTYTFAEAAALAKSECGSYDPYASNHARLQYRGNGDFILFEEDFVPIEDVVLSSTELSLYTANQAALTYEILPDEHVRYDAAWSVSDPSIATVDENGVVTARSEGEADIILTITDKALDTDVVITRTCKLKGLGDLHVTGISLTTTELELYENTNGESIIASVIPANATNKQLLYESSDESVVSVTADGIVKPVKAGKATVKVTTVDGGFTGEVKCVVKEADFAASVNMTGGNLPFENSAEYPFIATVKDGRACVVSTNAGVDNSKSQLTLNAGLLETGSELTFDWKSSCEPNCDKLIFSVNGEKVEELFGMSRWETVTYRIKKTGSYTFTWSYEKDRSDRAYDDCAWLDEIDLYRYGELHTVTFLDCDRETVIASVQTEHGKAAEAPEYPKDSMYRFMGWSVSTAVVRSDLTVYAIGVLPGDATGDGMITTADAVLVLRQVVGYVQLEGEKLEAADYDDDGNINAGDAVLILRKTVGLI